MKILNLYLGHGGYCFARENHSLRNGRHISIKFYALFGLIRHPQEGWILYDTGYTRRFYEATSAYPEKIYALATKVVVEEMDEAKMQMEHLGLEPADIKHVILSHFHADHVGGLKDFEQARVYCSRTAWEKVQSIKTVLAFTKGILKALLPENLEDRIEFIEEKGNPLTDPIFGIYYDLFGDDSIKVYMLPGHAAGQIGIVLSTAKKTFFLAADACWSKKAYEERTLPNPIVSLFFDSWSDYKDTLEKLHHFHLLHPEISIVPTHCFETSNALFPIDQKLHEV